jgi:hypothetical protein
MRQHVNLEKLTPAEQIVGEDGEDTRLLKEMLQEATNYLRAFRWCPPIDQVYQGNGTRADRDKKTEPVPPGTKEPPSRLSRCPSKSLNC